MAGAASSWSGRARTAAPTGSGAAARAPGRRLRDEPRLRCDGDRPARDVIRRPVLDACREREVHCPPASIPSCQTDSCPGPQGERRRGGISMSNRSYDAISVAAALALSVALAPEGWTQTPAGAEFRVNTYTTSAQRRPALIKRSNGDFVITWHSDGQDGSGYGVRGQRFNAAG